ncbi:2-oxoacid:acceptor oxidoreductase subunit alpha [Desulfovibrio sp. 86]|uniref:2-oxoglutarate synthase subunit KorA n=1 Tax=uncultured Desulfovibrio sp. TaxID=167968 RepID=A0A212LA14_9BACT|nr:2-oxoacid:acceptor oxidoreductase subunit alpha [Desulfovibrio sp. 86]SCM74403.1 2-oxoglutarate synthase subunit KorA [uncultured Desulfovibrio sp.]VZH34813.1 2-oxoglutarate synthase subunit KorA [Desulfovibrio sp. 86]
MKENEKLMQGNEAIASAALYAGLSFYAGYPITPSSEIAEICAKELPKTGGVFMQLEDEIASMAAIIGASASGAKALTATSGPGFSLMQEHISAAVIMETPVVVVNVQRQGPCVGLATKPEQADLIQLGWGRHGDQAVVALIPATVAECFELTVKAFNIAEKYRVPVILAPDEQVGHVRENITVPAPGELPVINRTKPSCAPEAFVPLCFEPGAVAPMSAFGDGYITRMTASMSGEDGCSNSDPDNASRRVAQLHSKLEAGRNEIVMIKTYDVDDCDVLIVAIGSPVRCARTVAKEARAEGKRVGVLQILTMWPFPYEEIAPYLKKARKVIVPEMNYAGQMAGEVLKCIDDPGKLIKVNTFNGQIIKPEDIAKHI